MMKNLLENQCGAQNPLVQLGNQLKIANEQQQHKSLIVTNHHQKHTFSADEFVNEYMASGSQGAAGSHKNLALIKHQHAPRSFHMGALLSELREMDESQKMAATGKEQQFYKPQTNGAAPITRPLGPAETWSDEYELTLDLSNQHQQQQPLTNRQQLPYQATASDSSLKWSIDYLNQNESKIYEENDIFQFKDMKNFLANQQQQNSQSMADNQEDDKWVTEFINESLAAAPTTKLNGAGEAAGEQEDFWKDFQYEWSSAEGELIDNEQPWLEDFQKTFDSYRTYEFEKENHLESHPNPFEEGLERLKVHDIVNAVLLFEVAVKKDPSNMLAWQYLGTTQVENEQDVQAIRALRKCLELKPDNLTALSTLATSYTNENMQRMAFNALLKWLKFNPDYAKLFETSDKAKRLWNDFVNSKEHSNKSFYNIIGVVHGKEFQDLQEIYLEAVRSNSAFGARGESNIDADLQCCLGILFHLANEYDKAADCFETAVKIRPKDHLLWNKLGATYANNNRNEESIQAYYQALNFCPGFVRARYNLGIGCMNLKAYKVAVEHFLTALVQQSQADITGFSSSASASSASNKEIKSQQMSETIWNTLRLALSYLDRSDLIDACQQKDLDSLRKEFGI